MLMYIFNYFLLLSCCVHDGIVDSWAQTSIQTEGFDLQLSGLPVKPLTQVLLILTLKIKYGRNLTINYSLLPPGLFFSLSMSVMSVRNVKSKSHWESSSWMCSVCFDSFTKSLISGNNSVNLAKNVPLLSHLTSVWSSRSVCSAPVSSRWARNSLLCRLRFVL